MRIFLIICASLLSFSAVAQQKKAAGQQRQKITFDRAAFENYVRHLELWGPQIKVDIADPEPAVIEGFYLVKVHAAAGAQYKDDTWYVSRDGQKMFRAPVHDIRENPFKEENLRLDTSNAPGFGAEGAPVKVVVFSDFQCPYCKEEGKILRNELKNTYPTQARVYFMDFPLDQIHPWARPAAIAGRCVFRQKPGTFWAFHDWIFERQGEMTPENVKSKVLDWSKTQNLDGVQLGVCMDTKATEEEVNKSVAVGRSVGVDRTPYIFINGRRLPGADWQTLKHVIDFEINYQKTARNAGDENCCSVALDNPSVKR
jgi:protein-disulfide isomerase